MVIIMITHTHQPTIIRRQLIYHLDKPKAIQSLPPKAHLLPPHYYSCVPSPMHRWVLSQTSSHGKPRMEVVAAILVPTNVTMPLWETSQLKEGVDPQWCSW